MNDALFRMRDLLLLERGGVLDATERAELDRLLAMLDGDTRAALERERDAAMAAIDRAFASSDIADRLEDDEPLPASLRSRIESTFPDAGQTGDRGARDILSPTRSVSTHRPRTSWAGWAVAACLAVALAALLFQRPRTPALTTPDVQALVDAAPDVVRVPMASNDPSQPTAGGEVVWSTNLQRGYLALKGVQPNDHASSQFQLWLIDPNRDPHPIDAGVFDVPAGATIVPFTPALASVDPQAFAVTAEVPGGVVVTDGPILMLGKRE